MSNLIVGNTVGNPTEHWTIRTRSKTGWARIVIVIRESAISTSNYNNRDDKLIASTTLLNELPLVLSLETVDAMLIFYLLALYKAFVAGFLLVGISFFEAHLHINMVVNDSDAYVRHTR